MVCVSKNGNLIILTALLLPVMVFISGISIDMARYFFYKNMIEEAISQAIEEETVAICNADSQSLDKNILHDIRISLLNDLNEEEINRLLQNTQVKLDLIYNYKESNKYKVSVHSAYSIETNALTQILGFSKINKMEMEIDIYENINCPHISGIFMSDIKTWRPETAQDETKQMGRFDVEKFSILWKSINDAFVNNVKNLALKKDVSFYSLSGNMTDFGEELQTYMFTNTYSKSLGYLNYLHNDIPVYPSMGPSEYINNVGRCVISDFILASTGCAFNTVKRLANEISGISHGNYGKNFNSDSLYKVSYSYLIIKHHNITKSQAYSWNIGNLHFIQTHYSLFNSVNFNDAADRIYVNIDQLIDKNGKISDWLIKDVNKAKLQDKHILLITYDLDHVLYYASNQQYNAFHQFLIDNHILAIISTSNDTMYKTSIAKVPTYYIGAALHKNFVLLEMKNSRSIEFTAFKDIGGTITKTIEMPSLRLN